MKTYGDLDEAIADAPRPHADDWTALIKTLGQEHVHIMSLLETLEEQAGRLEPRKVPDYLLLRDIVDYLLHYPDQYHHPRENLIYAELRDGGSAFRSKYNRLQREHEALHERNVALFAELVHACDGRPVDRRRLANALDEYVSVYRQHIRFESTEIFPQARSDLTESQLREIESKTRFRDDPLFSDETEQRFHRLTRVMKTRVGEIQARVLDEEYQLLERVIDLMTDVVARVGKTLPVGRLPMPPRLLGGPSWQAQLTNAVLMGTVKQIARFGTIESARGLMERGDALSEKRLPDDVRWKPVQGQHYDGEWIHILRKRPRKVLLYFPGGGFILRPTAQHRSLVGRICRAAKCKALLVHYRLAPETPFPGGLEDCLAAYHALLEQGVLPDDITLAGDSAGGGLVLSTLLALRDEGTAMPANAIVFSAAADMTFSGESLEYNRRRDPFIPPIAALQMLQQYVGELPPDDRYLSPVLADFDGLPPILGIVGSTEILLDDTVRAAERADEAGVPFFLEIWRQMPHVFPIFGFLPESEVAVERVGEFIQTGHLDPLPKRYGRSELPSRRT